MYTAALIINGKEYYLGHAPTPEPFMMAANLVLINLDILLPSRWTQENNKIIPDNGNFYIKLGKVSSSE